MNHTCKKLFLPILFCLLTNILWAQTAKKIFELENNETGSTRNYVARNYILLKSGFTYTATTSNGFNAKIDTTLVFTVASIPNPSPSDTTRTSNDGTYTPGNTFNDDMTDPVPVPSLTTSKINGSSNDISYIFPIIWFKTIPATNNLNGGYKWKDFACNNATINKYSRLGAGHGDEYVIKRDSVRTYNYNPAIDLSYDNVSKEILVKKSNLAQSTIIGVWGAKEKYNEDKFLFAINGRKDESVLFTKEYVFQTDPTKTNLCFGDNFGESFLCQSDSTNLLNKFHEKSLRIGTYYRTNKPNTSVWGEPQKAVISLGYKLDTANVNNTSSFNAQWQNLGEFKGYTPELLVFDRQLSPLDCRIFESYLAIKYGISLDTSYVSAKGDVIWDYGFKKDYNNRITGYGREDALGLSQKMATTSYEENPFYANDSDSYEANDSYHLSSPSRLLVMGCEPSNTMDDGTYVVFGDNGKSYAVTDSLAPGYRTMSRKWLIQTNITQSSNSETILTWKDPGLVIAEKNNSIFISDIRKPVSENSASMVTANALKGKDGYFLWTVGQSFGPVIVKFGTNRDSLTQNSYDYGYKIAANGEVFSIQKGMINENSIFDVEQGQRLEVEKNGRILFMRVNGIRYKATEIAIDSTQKDSTYYGAIIIGSNSSEVYLFDFRHGGFVDTGHRIELSFLPQRASGFANYLNSKPCLIIDRAHTGNGDFSGMTNTYSYDEVDTERSKVIFNNVFLEDKDVFTFGYSKGITSSSVKINISEEIPEPEENKWTDDVQIYYKDMNDLSTVTVKVQMEKPSNITIMVYDLLGKCIERRALSDNNNVQFSDIKLPTAGIYIIKVTTKNMQYSQEVISKN